MCRCRFSSLRSAGGTIIFSTQIDTASVIFTNFFTPVKLPVEIFFQFYVYGNVEFYKHAFLHPYLFQLRFLRGGEKTCESNIFYNSCGTLIMGGDDTSQSGSEFDWYNPHLNSYSPSELFCRFCASKCQKLGFLKSDRLFFRKLFRLSRH